MKRFALLLLSCAALSAFAQRTPTMGWSSWNTFALNINENLIRQQADAMHQSGLQAAGYRYVNIDDGYWDGRGDDGHLRVNAKLFPNGMRALVDYIHSLGLKAGIYSDAGDCTCGSGTQNAWGRNVGLAGYEEQDCRLYFDEWDFDFIKVDYCGGRHMKLDEREQYTKISNAIRSCEKKDVVFNVCRWAFPGTWIGEVSDSWRTTGDIYDAWKSVRGILSENLYLSAYCHDGHYNDMDMLEVGRSMTQTEDETHFGMWCIMASPLLIGCDMANIRPESLKLLCNKDLIALNQDPLHLQAYIAEYQNGCYILVKDLQKLHSTTRAIAVYNPTDEEKTVTLDMLTVDLGGKVQLFDCIQQKDFGTVKGSVELTVPAHGTKIFRAKAQKRLVRKTYEAETAWLSRYHELGNDHGEGAAIYDTKEGASGGYVARFLGKKPGNDIIWKDVWVNKAGEYTLTIDCFCGDVRFFNLEVNGQTVRAFVCDGMDDWTTPFSMSAKVMLKKGNNTVRLYNDSFWMPDVDRMTIE